MIFFSTENIYCSENEIVKIVLLVKKGEAEEKLVFPMVKEENGKYSFDSKGYNVINYHFLVGEQRIYTHKIEICVASTMSSGKSTFINALLGHEVLPSENQACTGKLFKIENNPTEKTGKIVFKKNNKKKKYYLNEEN